jgi:hypothetical protein
MAPLLNPEAGRKYRHLFIKDAQGLPIIFGMREAGVSSVMEDC